MAAETRLEASRAIGAGLLPFAREQARRAMALRVLSSGAQVGAHTDAYADMFLCVRTTIDIPDALLSKARQQALTEGTTLRALVADSLRARLEGDSSPGAVGIEVEVYGGSGLAVGCTEADLFAREERDLQGTWRNDSGQSAAAR